MIIPMVALSLCGSVYETDPDGEWSICYTVVEEGPLHTYMGRVNVHGDYDPYPCLNYTLEIPDGDLIGYSFRWDPYEEVQVRYAMLPFSSWQQTSDSLSGTWCSPGELDYWQSTPLHFKFSVQKTRFDADDLSEMLANWGNASPWDLNGNGVVDGADITIMLAGWEAPS